MKKSITVYCASSNDLDPIYIEAARQLGAAAAGRGVNIVTGAGYTGLMGAVADAALGAGGTVTGIIPQFMVDRGWHHRGLTRLVTVDTMHSRKAMMASESCAAIALPGGIGTFEELLEIITWRQLGLFGGNVVILNANNYYDPLIAMMRQAVEQGFMRPDHMRLFTVAATVDEALAAALARPEQLTFTPKF